MENVLSLNDTINIGKTKIILVSDIVKVKGKIFDLIKNGFLFDDEVLKEAHITKIIRDVKFSNVFSSHQDESKKTYQKETESLKNILKSLNTLDNPTEETYNVDENKTVSEESLEEEL